ncbi:oxidoreductase [Chitinophaga silvatica]|uniref:Oxidoreductase n=1 Tax=Chitinophaga silvatica TaxID=2282649 RepID=A0A3E1YGJ3_9BACT|nr:oxidoreductase [Chitinophaga silvatica]RFS26492.1 oxidoreductase [Chitinophaga silvatica]
MIYSGSDFLIALRWPFFMKKKSITVSLLFFLILSKFPVLAQEYSIKTLPAPPAKSLRGISVVNDSVLWASGTGSQVGRSTDGGNTWEWNKIGACDSCDWRSLYAFDDKSAIVLNAGSPAHIYATIDGGRNWQEKHLDTTSGIFFDGLQFMDQRQGIAIGDPIDGKFIVIQTQNKGNSWKRDKAQLLPEAREGEAIFAASGTSLIIRPDKKPCFVTGGSVSRFWIKETNWKAYTLPLIQGSSTKGAFSVAFYDQHRGIIVGGDYQQPGFEKENCILTEDGGKTWKAAGKGPGGYRSCVAYLTDKLLISTGTNGTDISEDGGRNWRRIGEGYNAVAKARNGTAVYLVGSKVARLEISLY